MLFGLYALYNQIEIIVESDQTIIVKITSFQKFDLKLNILECETD